MRVTVTVKSEDEDENTCGESHVMIVAAAAAVVVVIVTNSICCSKKAAVNEFCKKYVRHRKVITDHVR